MTDDLEAATDRVFAAMDEFRTGEAVHATRQVAKALARAALDGVREKALDEAAKVGKAEALDFTHGTHPFWEKRVIDSRGDEHDATDGDALDAVPYAVHAAILALISKAD
jgi:hypothetical protein